MLENSLYERIGGDDTLRQLVDLFYDNVYKNDLIARLFVSDITVIKEKQRLFLTQFLGGPQLYSDQYGHPKMRARHMPHAITEEDAVEWLSCMANAVNHLNIAEELKDELFARFPNTALFMVNTES
jgi:hemoglobin